ncbi:MAG: hypothetical protein AAF328_07220 [Planctomycetota bacterium]
MSLSRKIGLAMVIVGLGFPLCAWFTTGYWYEAISGDDPTPNQNAMFVVGMGFFAILAGGLVIAAIGSWLLHGERLI